MNVQTFLDNFGHIANAPDGVKRLRELIFTLAMRGKLVAQRPSDPPARELLREIEAEKERLVKEKKIKSIPHLPQVTAEEVPYVLPCGWEWVRLGIIGNIFTGNSINAREKEVKYRGSGLPYIATKDVEYGFSSLNYSNGIFIPENEEKFKIAHQGAVLLCSEGGSAGKKCGITDRNICFGNKLFANELFGGIPPKYVLYQYLTPFFQSLFKEAMTGIIGGVSIAKFLELFIPLAPLTEQKRIVAKVDELMTLCDKLEAQQQEQERCFPILSRVSHVRFVETPTLANLKAIFDETESVSPDDLRKTILSLAVQGKLVPQNQNDEPIEGIIKRISIDQSGTKPKQSELPFKLPSSWSVSKLASILKPNRGISYGIIKLGPEPLEGGVNVLRCSNVRFRRIDLTGIRKVAEELSSEYGRTVLEGGELLINIRGTLGGCAIVPPSLKGFNIAREVAVVPVHREMDPMFLLNVVASPYFQDKIDDSLRGIAYKGLNLGLLRDFLIPIPPLTEQRLIVSKVEQLMILVDQLQEHQNNKAKLAEAFTQTSISAITGIEIKEHEKMKAPKIELVTKLQIGSKPKATDKAPLVNIVAKYQGELSAKSLWQQSGLEIDAFYQQLKAEMAKGWIVEPEKGAMQEVGGN